MYLRRSVRIRVSASAGPAERALAGEEKEVYRFIEEEPVSAEHLIQKSGFSAARILGLLSRLEIKGIIRQLPGKLFVKR